MKVTIKLSMKSHKPGDENAVFTKREDVIDVSGDLNDVDQHLLQETVVANALEHPKLAAKGYTRNNVLITNCEFTTHP